MAQRHGSAFLECQWAGAQLQSGLIGPGQDLHFRALGFAGWGGGGANAIPFCGNRGQGYGRVTRHLTGGPQSPARQLLELVSPCRWYRLAAALPEAEVAGGLQTERQLLGAVLVAQANLADQLAEQEGSVFLNTGALEP